MAFRYTLFDIGVALGYPVMADINGTGQHDLITGDVGVASDCGNTTGYGADFSVLYRFEDLLTATTTKRHNYNGKFTTINCAYDLQDSVESYSQPILNSLQNSKQQWSTAIKS